MKTTTLLLQTFLVSIPSLAQPDRSMQVYVMAGFKSFSDKAFNSPVSVAPSMVPTIGGGALWNFNRFQAGAEFNYLDGKKETDEFGSILTGINSNVLVGYSWPLGLRTRVTTQTGFGYSLHHLAVTDHTFSGTTQLNSTIYHNMVISVPIALMVQRVSPGGVMTALRLGYQLPVGHNLWRYIEGDQTVNYDSGNDGLYVQLIFGGLLGLKSKAE